MSNRIIKSRDRKVVSGQVVNFLLHKNGLFSIMHLVHNNVCQTELYFSSRNMVPREYQM